MPRYRHIVVLMDTDHDYGSILHDKYAPTINRLARRYGLASRYYTVADPDIANEMALLAGSPFGISDSAPYWDDQLHRTSPLTQLGAPHKTWKEYAQSLPYPGYLGDCFPVLCVETDSDVWAVGTDAGPGGVFRTLVEHWVGRRWHVVPSPDPGAGADTLTAVTSGPGGVLATGQALSGSAPDRELVLRLSGSSATVAGRVTGRSGADVYPEAIAASPAGLWAAGNQRSGHAGFTTLVQAPGPGGRLAGLRTPSPTRQDNYLTGIAPVGRGSTAWAVGNSVQAASGNAVALIEHGSAGGGWTIVPSPSPGLAGNGNTFLNAVLAFGGGTSGPSAPTTAATASAAAR